MDWVERDGLGREGWMGLRGGDLVERDGWGREGWIG